MVIWNQMVDCIRRIANEVLAQAKEKTPIKQLGDGVQRFRKPCERKDIATKFDKGVGTEKIMKSTRRLIKKLRKQKGMQKLREYDNLQNKLRNKRGRDIFKLLKMMERKSRDLDHVKCLKTDYQKVLVKDNDIKERWEEYFNKF